MKVVCERTSCASACECSERRQLLTLRHLPPHLLISESGFSERRPIMSLLKSLSFAAMRAQLLERLVLVTDWSSSYLLPSHPHGMKRQRILAKGPRCASAGWEAFVDYQRGGYPKQYYSIATMLKVAYFTDRQVRFATFPCEEAGKGVSGLLSR